MIISAKISLVSSTSSTSVQTFEDQLLGTVYGLVGDAVVQRRVTAERQAVDLCTVLQQQGDAFGVGHLAGDVKRRLPVGHGVDGRAGLEKEQGRFHSVVHHTHVDGHGPGLLQFVAWEPVT